jgi:hypothetical protein
MTPIMVTLLILNVLVPVAATYRCCVSRAGIEVNHVMTFSMAFVAYWVCPLPLLRSELLAGRPEFMSLRTLAGTVTPASFDIYMLVTLSCYLSFWAGASLGMRRAGRGRRYRPALFRYETLRWFVLPAALAAAATAYSAKERLFRGYQVDVIGVNDMGPFASCTLALLGIAFVATFKRLEIRLANRERMGEPTFLSCIGNGYFLVYLAFGCVLVSTGARLYIVSTLIMVAAFYSVYIARLSMRRIALFALIVAVTVSTIGEMRLGSGIAVDSLFVNMLSEPLYTSFSHIFFVSSYSVEILRAPILLLGDFINLVPSALLPAKADLLFTPDKFGFVVYSPFGALSSYFSFMVNFGAAGACAALFCFSYWLSCLRTRGRSLVSHVSYVMVTGFVATTFFRDPFSVSIVKAIVQFSLFFPFLIVLLATMLTTRPARAGSRSTRAMERAEIDPESPRAAAQS